MLLLLEVARWYHQPQASRLRLLHRPNRMIVMLFKEGVAVPICRHTQIVQPDGEAPPHSIARAHCD